jgi:membrane-associated phospholipid phosphatase
MHEACHRAGVAGVKAFAKRVLAAMGPDVALVIVFFVVLATLIGVYGGSFKWHEGPILISIACGMGLVAIRARSARSIARDWAPLIVVLWMFQSLETYTGVIRTTSIDEHLYAADVALFGVEPSVWAGQFSTPLLTDYMALAYGLYFIMPMVLAVMLSLRGRRDDFREMSTAVVLQMGIGFVLFLIFPAGPPRFYGPLVDGGFDPPQLHSYFGLWELQQGAFDSADPVRTRSAFPSLHCSLALLTLIYSYRFSDAVFPRFPRLWFRIVLPFVVSLWISTVYLRHHWVVDIAAGLALGFVANALAPALRRYWPRH